MYANTRRACARNERVYGLRGAALVGFLRVLLADDLLDHDVAVEFPDHAFDLGNLVA
jgi:hypothetical protein